MTDRRNKANKPATDRPVVYARRASDLRKIRVRSLVKATLFITLIATMVLSASAVASYHRMPMVRIPFNYTAAATLRVTGVPAWLTVRALDDGLLQVYAHNDMLGVHNWLRAQNPSGIDYEYELRRVGWSNWRVHALGSMFNVSAGPF